jgi:CheY-like chemotaxis protein
VTPTPTVLVADSDGPSRKLARAVLEHEGFVVLEAWEAGDAVALAIEHRPAAVLLDLRLPGIDAFETLATLASHPTTRGTMLIATTAVAAPEHLERCRAAGFADVLVKPIAVRDLADLARGWRRALAPR